MTENEMIRAEVWGILEDLQRQYRGRWDPLEQLPMAGRKEYAPGTGPEYYRRALEQGTLDYEAVTDAIGLLLRYAADGDERREAIHTLRTLLRSAGFAGDTPAARMVTGLIQQAEQNGRYHCGASYEYALREIEDSALRREVFRLLSEETPHLVYLDGQTPSAPVRINYLWIRFLGRIAIGREGLSARHKLWWQLPAEYFCTDHCGDVWQCIGEGQIDYTCSGGGTVDLEYEFPEDDFCILRMDASCSVETETHEGWLVIGMDLRAVPLKAEWNCAKWNCHSLKWRAELCPEQQLQAWLELAGVRYPYEVTCLNEDFFLLDAPEGGMPAELCERGFLLHQWDSMELVLARTWPDGTSREYRLPCPARLLTDYDYTGYVYGSWQDGLTMELAYTPDIIDYCDGVVFGWQAEYCPEYQLQALLEINGVRYECGRLLFVEDGIKIESPGSGFADEACVQFGRMSRQDAVGLVFVRTWPDGAMREYCLSCPVSWLLDGDEYTIMGVVKGSWQDGLTMEPIRKQEEEI